MISFLLICLVSITISQPLENKNYLRLNEFVKRLEEYAPLYTASVWDNVGLLVEPSDNILIKKVLATNDLTEATLDEAIAKNVNLIIAYHPPMVKQIPPHTDLKPVSRLTQSTWKQSSLVKCIENQIAVYSPHTTWDCIDGGINDWILSAFNTTKITSILKTHSPKTTSGFDNTVKLRLSIIPNHDITHTDEILLEKIRSERFSNIKLIGSIKINDKTNINSTDTFELEFFSNNEGVTELEDFIRSFYKNENLKFNRIVKTMQIFKQEKPLMKNVGLGRIGYLEHSIKISEVVSKMKKLLNQKMFRIALANEKSLDDEVKVLAIGAGSGTGLLVDTVADFIITGEYVHHDILHEIHRGTSVLITDHSNTERGYINVFKERFLNLLKENNESVELIVSKADRDPIDYI